jgi:hypothetical protein
MISLENNLNSAYIMQLLKATIKPYLNSILNIAFLNLYKSILIGCYKVFLDLFYKAGILKSCLFIPYYYSV